MPTEPLRIIDISRPGLDGLLDSLTVKSPSYQSEIFVRRQGARRRYQFVLPSDTPGTLFDLQTLTGSVVEVLVGLPDQAVTGGTFSGSYQAATDDLTGLAYNISSAALQTALNANSAITSAGGVTVTALGSTGHHLIVFNSNGARDPILWDTDSITPSGYPITPEVQVGDADKPSIQVLQIVQSPYAYLSMSGGDIDVATATGTLSFSRAALYAAFANTTADSINAELQIRITWSGETEPDIVYRSTCTILRTMLEGSGSLPALPTTPLTFPYILQSVTGYTGGGATNLDGFATVSAPVGTIVAFVHATDGLRFYQLTAGTDAEASPGIIRPDDYAASTNEKVWISVL